MSRHRGRDVRRARKAKEAQRMAGLQADIIRAFDGYQIVADETSGALKNAGGSLPLNSLCLKVLARLIEAAIEASKKQGGSE